MNNKKVKNLTIDSFIWLLVYLMPILVIIARIFTNFHNTNNNRSIIDILNEFNSMINFSSNTFVLDLKDFIVNIFGASDTLYITCLVNVISYLVLVKILYLVYKFITLIIDIVCKMFRKWSD